MRLATHNLNPEIHLIAARLIDENQKLWQLWLYEKNAESQSWKAIEPVSQQAVKLTKRRKAGLDIAQELGIPFAKRITIGATMSAAEKAKQKQERKRQRQQHLIQCWEQWQCRYQSPRTSCCPGSSICKSMDQKIWQAEVDPFHPKTYKVYSGKELDLRNRAYDIKEKWIEANQVKLVKGEKVRLERSNFDGFSNNYDQRRWLYLHVFNIEGVEFRFHSYLEPKHLSNELGIDLKSYGTPLSQAEIADIEISLNDLLGVIKIGMEQLTAQ
jgi:hypothetical protein